MKGTIVKCLEELVTSQYGETLWKNALEEAGLDKSIIFFPFDDVDDAVIMNIIQILCGNLKLSLPQLADKFGDYWVNEYAKRLYPRYFTRYTTARDLLLAMNDIHAIMTRMIARSKPPRFESEWENENTLIIHYISHRGLIDLAVGLVKGVGKCYNEKLQVTKIGDDRMKVVFQGNIA